MIDDGLKVIVESSFLVEWKMVELECVCMNFHVALVGTCFNASWTVSRRNGAKSNRIKRG
jgi:hypothetical protein